MARTLSFCFTTIEFPSSPENTLPENHSRPFSNHSPSLLIKNFNSLYEDSASAASAADPDHISTSESEIDTDGGTPEFSTAVASQRFFFSSPGRSNSIIDSSSSRASTSSSSSLSAQPNQKESDTVSCGGGIAVPRYSPDPFADFRRSMQEMVEARAAHDVRENWDYLHELLRCYLSLNPKSTHKFIVEAFSDLVVSLMIEKGRPPETPSSDGKCKISRKCV
ncbi:hypothetical protein OROGR_019388 [Orobanche gracilis]